ncbi:hypothetical protein [Paenibacillus wulumuqiensis]|nr:hypothetical protein [Paenibacillus wulumuqiensis]
MRAGVQQDDRIGSKPIGIPCQLAGNDRKSACTATHLQPNVV